MRMIDADELKKQIHSHHWDIYDNIDEVYKIIDNAPTIEPKRSKWISCRIEADEMMKFPIRANKCDKKNANEHFIDGIKQK